MKGILSAVITMGLAASTACKIDLSEPETQRPEVVELGGGDPDLPITGQQTYIKTYVTPGISTDTGSGENAGAFSLSNRGEVVGHRSYGNRNALLVWEHLNFASRSGRNYSLASTLMAPQAQAGGYIDRQDANYLLPAVITDRGKIVAPYRVDGRYVSFTWESANAAPEAFELSMPQNPSSLKVMLMNTSGIFAGLLRTTPESSERAFRGGPQPIAESLLNDQHATDTVTPINLDSEGNIIANVISQDPTGATLRWVHKTDSYGMRRRIMIPGVDNVTAIAVSENGNLLLQTETAGVSALVVKTAQSMIPLDDYYGSPVTIQAHSMNADGMIIGTVVEGSGHIPVIFDSATSAPRDLRFTAGLTGTDYESVAINDNGQILVRECNHPSCSDAPGFLNARLVLLTPTYCSNSVRGDANGDGVVDSFDYDALAQATHPSASERQAYRATHPDVNVLCALDINLDGKVDRTDMLALRIPGVTSGDANFDGQVDVLDIDSLARALTDPDAFRASVGYHGSLTMLGDVNGSGIFDLADVLYLYRLCPGYDVRYRINNLAGDANGDLRVDNFDIDPFVERLLWGEDAYRQSHPWVLQMCSMDLDRDGRITFFDVNIFADNLVRQL